MALYDSLDKHTFRSNLAPQDNEGLDVGIPGRRFRNLYAKGATIDSLTVALVNGIAPPSLPLDLSAVASPSLIDLNGTDRSYSGLTQPGLRWQLAYGTVGAPVTVGGGALKVARTLGQTVLGANCTNWVDNECGAAVSIVAAATATDKMMNVGLSSIAFGDNTGPSLLTAVGDQVGVYGVGRKAGGEGTATGAYFEARRDSAGTATGIPLVGAEITTRNITATDCTYSGGNSNCKSVWITGLGSNPGLLGVGAAIRDSGPGGSGHFQGGFVATDYSVGPYGGAAFEDWSEASFGLRIGSAHAKEVGLKLDDGSFTTAALKLSGATVLDGKILWAGGGGLFIEGNTPKIGMAVDNTGAIGDATHRWNTINATTFSSGVNNGQTKTYNMRAAGGAGDCTIIVVGGIVAGGTC